MSKHIRQTGKAERSLRRERKRVVAQAQVEEEEEKARRNIGINTRRTRTHKVRKSRFSRFSSDVDGEEKEKVGINKKSNVSITGPAKT